MADIPEIPPSPPAPARTQAPDTFSAAADRFAAYIEQMPAYYNAFGAAMEVLAGEIANQGFSATSSTAMTIGTGTKTFTASTGAAFIGGQTVLISSTASSENNMTGTVVNYDSTTGVMEVDVDTISGSGSFSAWAIGLTLSVDLSAYLQKAGGTMTGLLTLADAQGLVLTPGSAPGSPVDGQIWRETNKLMARVGLASLEVVLATLAQTLTNKTLTSPAINGGVFTDYTEAGPSATTGSSLSPNLANGTLFRLITNANATITLPTPVAGKSFTVVVEYGGAHTLSWAGGTRKWAGGTAPTPTSVSGKIDVFTFICLDGSNWLAFVSGRNL